MVVTEQNVYFDYFGRILQLSTSEDEENTYLYDLVVTVAHILDPRTGGSLVAHIKVGETYHQRKEVQYNLYLNVLLLKNFCTAIEW